jgi:hypothetical protein
MALPSSSPKFHVLLLVTLVLSFCIPAFSQTETATVSGTITDQTGAAVPGADVKLVNVLTGITATTKSNGTGLYVFPTVRPSQYRMTVEKPGFRQVVLTDLTVNVQDTLSRNFKLQLGVVGESVTVSGATETVNTQSAAVSTVVDSQFVENMPLNGRSFQSLIELTPGVLITPVSSSFSPGMFSVDGQRTNTNYFTVDGVSANFGTNTGFEGAGQSYGGSTPAVTSGGGTNGLVSVDAMQEFRIQTSSYAPEFGRSPGAQISIVTKGGTNQWHGMTFSMPGTGSIILRSRNRRSARTTLAAPSAGPSGRTTPSSSSHMKVSGCVCRRRQPDTTLTRQPKLPSQAQVPGSRSLPPPRQHRIPSRTVVTCSTRPVTT